MNISNLAIESQAIGSCLADPNCIDALVEGLTGGAMAFYDVRNRAAFLALTGMRKAGEPVCAYSLFKQFLGADQTAVLSAAEISVMQDQAVPQQIGYWIDELNAAYANRQCAATLADAQLAAEAGRTPQEIAARMQSKLSELSEPRRSVRLGAPEASDLLITDLERRHALQGRLSGIETGFGRLDRMLEGLQFGDQTIIAARPSAGKSAIGVNIASHVCLTQGIPTAFVSLEMSVPALMRRLLACAKRLPMWNLKAGELTQGNMATIASFTATARKAPLYFLDYVGGAGVDSVCASIRGLCRKHGVKLVIVDYLQKIRPTERQEKRTYEVAEVSGLLKACAVDTGAAFLTLAQLNRESERDKGRVPRLTDLADSGQIERDADTVVLIHRPRTESDPQGERAVLIVAKQRDGEVGSFELKFNGQFCAFENPIVTI